MEPFDRKLPAIFAAGTIALLLLHHWYVVTEGSAFIYVLLVVPMVTGLAIGGLIYPPIFWSIGPRGKNLPASIKALGALSAVAGLGFGLYLAKFVYKF
jgi:archaellum biogenesis protein FlaJ (TadC family)